MSIEHLIQQLQSLIESGLTSKDTPVGILFDFGSNEPLVESIQISPATGNVLIDCGWRF